MDGKNQNLFGETVLSHNIEMPDKMFFKLLFRKKHAQRRITKQEKQQPTA